MTQIQRIEKGVSEKDNPVWTNGKDHCSDHVKSICN